MKKNNKIKYVTANKQANASFSVYIYTLKLTNLREFWLI